MDFAGQYNVQTRLHKAVQITTPLPTSPEENKRKTKSYLVAVASCMYALILITLGVVVHIASPFVGYSQSIYFSIGICSIGMAYQIYLIIDVNRYKAIALKNDNYSKKGDHTYECGPVIDDRPDELKRETSRQRVQNSVSRDYCFKYGRHSGSFFLKLGATGLACGHFVHSVLLITVQIGQLLDPSVDNDECVIKGQILLDVLSPCYCFLQLYFIFNYSKIIIMKRTNLARWALMHIIASSLCFWLATIIRETLLTLILYANSIYGNMPITTAAPKTNSVQDPVTRFFDVSGLYNEHCAGTTLLLITQHASPYLYPFGIEFYIIIVAIYYMMWINIDRCPNYARYEGSKCMEEYLPICRIPPHDIMYSINVMFQGICHPSNRGSALGIFLMVIIAGTLIIGLLFSKVGGEYVKISIQLRESTMLALHVIMLVANVMAFNRLKKLDINKHPISLLDDTLLFICIPAFALELTLSFVATPNDLPATNYFVMAIQVIVQTLLIVDGLRRCSNTREHQQKKPGREVITFLIMTNIGMWFYYTFYKPPDDLDERKQFFGPVSWAILGHLSLPLIMFYRFHSSVCFADIWKSAYRPALPSKSNNLRL